MFKKGEIYLARLNPKKGNEVGKLRPVLIYQTNLLNECLHPTSIVLPLSTVLIDDAYPLRYRILKRDMLKKDSDILCDQIRAIDNTRIISDVLTRLTQKEIFEIDKQVKIILDIDI
jgi:mRNA interferase MazF